MKTLEDAKAWRKEHEAECLKAYVECKSIPDFFRSSRLEEIWLAGCWLKDRLVKTGMTSEQADEVTFCLGQKSVYGDPWEIAVAYANEYTTKGSIADKPGAELGLKLATENKPASGG
jgi:hypothetical protein